MAFGLATQLEFLCCEQLCQAIKKHQKDGHGHDNHIVTDAAEGEKKHRVGKEVRFEKRHKIPSILIGEIFNLVYKTWNYKKCIALEKVSLI